MRNSLLPLLAVLRGNIDRSGGRSAMPAWPVVREYPHTGKIPAELRLQ
jgi:hypothetical protein